MPETPGTGRRADVECRRVGRLDGPLRLICYLLRVVMAVAAGAAPFLEAGGYPCRSEVRLSTALPVSVGSVTGMWSMGYPP